jgi:hypothetical protein
MKTIKFVVKVNRGTRAPEYVQRVDPTPLHMTTNPKLALLMGRLTAEERCRITRKLPVQPGVIVSASCIAFMLRRAYPVP